MVSIGMVELIVVKKRIASSCTYLLTGFEVKECFYKVFDSIKTIGIWITGKAEFVSFFNSVALFLCY